MTAEIGSPYKGLASFEDTDRDVQFFFGREREREIICANLMASKLTVLYGETGVGKSSVLRAGVARTFRSQGDPHAVVVFDAWRVDPCAGLTEMLAASGGVEPRATLADTLEACAAKLDGDVYVILDGVEEYFLYHEDESGHGTFFSEFPDAVKRQGLRASFLLAIREDALARLDRFKGSIPNLLGNYLRLAHLDREAGRSAIVGPLERYNELADAESQMQIEPGLVEAVLDEVVAGRVDLGQSGRGTVENRGDSDDRIEAPYLQLVMQRLWEAETEVGSRVFRASTLADLGGAQEIVRAHLERALDSLTSEQKEMASAVFNHLVTPSGTKIAHAVPDLARYAGVSQAELDPMLETLARDRILRTAANGEAPRYEIYHDVLGDAVMTWRAGHDAARDLEAEREAASRRHRRLLAVIVAAGVLLAAMAGITVFALIQRSRADTQARNAQARLLDSGAISQLGSDPALSLLLAGEAARLVPSRQAEETLRTAYVFSRERATFRARGPVSASSFSPDGKLVLVASEDGSARLFDAKTHRLVRSLTSGGTPLLGASFSSDGRRVVAGGQNGIARVWDVKKGTVIGALRHGAPVRSVALDPSGELAATAGGRHVKIWRTAGKLVVSLPWTKPVTRAFFSPDGELLLAIGNDPIARLYDASTGRLVRTFDQGGRVTSAAFAHNGSLVVTTGANGTARIWRVEGGRRVHELKGHRAAVLDAAFSPGGGRVATVSADGTGRIWNVYTGALAASIGGHKGIVEAVAFSPDGNFVVTGSTDRTAQTSKADDGTGRARLAGHGDAVHAVEYSPDGSRVLTASDDGTARLWDPAVQPQLKLVRRTGGPLVEAEYIGTGNRILVAGPGRQALVLRARGGRVVESMPARGPVLAVAASPNGQLLAIAGGRVVTLRRQGVGSKELVHPYKVTSVAISPDGTRIVAGGRKGSARLWSVDGKRLLELRGHKGEITDVAFSPDGSRIATSSRDKTARTWDATTGDLLRRFAAHTDDVTSVAFSPDGRLLLTASRDHLGRLWNAATGARTQVLRWHFGEVTDATFSPDGRWILTAGPVAVGLWQPGVQEPILPYGFGGHEPRIMSAVFDPRGHFVLTTGTDHTVRRAKCVVCGDLDDLLTLADAQLGKSRRKLTPEERERYGLD